MRTKLRDLVLHVDELDHIDQALWQYLQTTTSDLDRRDVGHVLRVIRCAREGVPPAKLRRQSFQKTRAFLDKYCPSPFGKRGAP